MKLSAFNATMLAQGVLGLGLILYGIQEARGHDFYEYRCCSDRDCRPVAEDAISEGPNGYVVKATGEVIPYNDKRIRQSPDQFFHWCSVGGKPDSRTLCIYVPNRGF